MHAAGQTSRQGQQQPWAVELFSAKCTNEAWQRQCTGSGQTILARPCKRCPGWQPATGPRLPLRRPCRPPPPLTAPATPPLHSMGSAESEGADIQGQQQGVRRQHQVSDTWPALVHCSPRQHPQLAQAGPLNPPISHASGMSRWSRGLGAALARHTQWLSTWRDCVGGHGGTWDGGWAPCTEGCRESSRHTRAPSGGQCSAGLPCSAQSRVGSRRPAGTCTEKAR